MSDVQKSNVMFALIAKGATREQAKGYMTLVRMFEKQSAGSGELHHILPRNSGWWKQYESASWNTVRVGWGFHIALHAYLFHIFPANGRLQNAIRATVMSRKAANPKKERLKVWITQKYGDGKSAEWIAAKTGLSDVTIRRWLSEWGVAIRSLSDSHSSQKKNRFKDRIIHWYQSRKKSSTWIAKRIGVGSAAIMDWLRAWGIKTRTTHETNSHMRTTGVCLMSKSKRARVTKKAGAISCHLRWHTKRNIIKPGCQFCDQVSALPAAA